jgi:hypothetical protein
MTIKYISGVLIIALSLALATPMAAQSGKIGYNGPVVAPIVGAAAGVAFLIVVVVHYSKKRSITGCVAASGNGMTVTDEKDKQIYMLAGSTTGVKAGDRIKVRGKRAKHTGSDMALVWNASEVSKDLGVCQP